MNEQMRELLETLNLSEDTVKSIQNLLTEALDAAKEEGKAEGKEEVEAENKEKVEELEESIADLEARNEFLMEKADEYGAYLMERANEYGSFLMEKANAYGDYIKESVTDKVKDYADFAVEQFIAENKERFVETEEYFRIKGAFDMIKESFERNGFDVRDDLAVQELQQSLNESTEEYEKVFEELQNAREAYDEFKREVILERATLDLADTQKEKVQELLESVSFDSTDEFEEGISLIVEQAKNHSASAVDDVLHEQSGAIVTKTIDPSVARYLGNSRLL